MQGAVFMGLASNAELSAIMNEAHYAVFGVSIEERKKEGASLWQQDAIDYSRFEQPAYGGCSKLCVTRSSLQADVAL
ncbi:MAG TPA: hypothetical protein VL027_00465 [Spongiibacteraceae bacterium]|nr:hypothetical protein [Spongiibacteraceae bacterium]